MCQVVFGYATANPMMISNHLRNHHDLVFCSGVLSRAMFLSQVGLREALEVLKDFDRRDMRLNLVTSQLMQQQQQPDRTVVLCSRMVQTDDNLETGVTCKEQGVKKFEEIWKNNLKNEDKKEVTLNVEEIRLFDDLEFLYESQNKEIAKLTSQLVLNKDYEKVLSEEVDRLADVVKNQQNGLDEFDTKFKSVQSDYFDLKSSQKAKDEEILHLQKGREYLSKTNAKLSSEVEDLNKLLERERKSSQTQLKENELKLKEALETVKADHLQNIIESTKESLKEVAEMNLYTSEKIIEAVSNTKKASRFMVKEVNKKFEEFKAEVDDLDIALRGISPMNSGIGKPGLCKKIREEVHTSDKINPETPADVSLRNSTMNLKKNHVKVVDYDEVSDSSDDENNNTEGAEMPAGVCTKRSIWDDEDDAMPGASKKPKC